MRQEVWWIGGVLGLALVFLWFIAAPKKNPTSPSQNQESQQIEVVEQTSVSSLQAKPKVQAKSKIATLNKAKARPRARLKRATSASKPTPVAVKLPKKRITARYLKQHGKLWLQLQDGSRLISTKGKGYHSDGHEYVSGGELWRVLEDGTLRRILPGVQVAEVRSSLSKNHVVAVGSDRNLYITQGNVEGKWETVGKKVNYFPVFDKKGKQLLYVEQKSLDHHQLWLRDLLTGKKHAIAAQPGGMSSPCFHPSGKAMVFASSQTGVASLWKVQLPKGKPIQITNVGLKAGGGLPSTFVPPPHEGKILWAGRWIVFDAGDALWGVKDDGTGAHKIVSESPLSFSWSQPGIQIVYQLRQAKQRVHHLPQ